MDIYKGLGPTKIYTFSSQTSMIFMDINRGARTFGVPGLLGGLYLFVRDCLCLIQPCLKLGVNGKNTAQAAKHDQFWCDRLGKEMYCDFAHSCAV
jgi:hypothetical protein